MTSATVTGIAPWNSFRDFALMLALLFSSTTIMIPSSTAPAIIALVLFIDYSFSH